MLVVAAAVGLATWALVGDRRDDDGSRPTTQLGSPRLVTAAEVAGLPAALGRTVYWAGPRAGAQYEVSERADGSVVIRYLPAGTNAGDAGSFLTVATYRQPDAFQRLRSAGRSATQRIAAVPGGGAALIDSAHPTNVHLAYPGIDAQAELFDPTARTALRLVRAGAVTPVDASARPVGPRAARPAELRTLATTLGQPVYWAGAQAGRVYELTVTPGGRIYVRYLPRDARIGNAQPSYLAIATYPVADAYERTKDAGDEKGNLAVDVPGGVGVLAKKRPANIYLAFPGQDLQIEVFHPSAAEALRLVLAGRITGVMPQR